MKIIGGVVLLFLITLGALVGYVIPDQYHKSVHEKLVPKILKDGQKAFKKIDFSHHETVITEKNVITSITSVSSFNPLQNHLLVSLKSADGKSHFKFKLRYEISKSLNLILELEDYTSLAATSISLQKPVIQLSTPLDRKLLSEKDRLDYLIFNTTIAFHLEKFLIGQNDALKPDAKMEFSGEKLSLEIGGSSPSKDLLVITAKMGLDKASVVQKEARNDATKLSYVIILNSFNIPGLKESYKGLFTKDEKNKDIPFMLTLMQKMPQIKKTVNFPFVFSNSIQAIQGEGLARMDMEMSVADPEKENMMNLFSIKFSALSPANFFEKQATATLSGLFTDIYKELYYPVGGKNPMYLKGFDEASQKEKNLILKETNEKISVIFSAFLNTEVEGKKRSAIYLDQIVTKKLLTKENDSYCLKGEFKQMQVSINGILNPMEHIMSLIPKEEVEPLMKENGLVSVFEGQAAPETAVPTELPQN